MRVQKQQPLHFESCQKFLLHFKGNHIYELQILSVYILPFIFFIYFLSNRIVTIINFRRLPLFASGFRKKTLFIWLEKFNPDILTFFKSFHYWTKQTIKNSCNFWKVIIIRIIILLLKLICLIKNFWTLNFNVGLSYNYWSA